MVALRVSAAHEREREQEEEKHWAKDLGARTIKETEKADARYSAECAALVGKVIFFG